MTTYRIDTKALYALLDTHRKNQGISWREVARQTGMSSSSFTWISKGKAPNSHALVTLLIWMGTGVDIMHLATTEET